MVSSNLTSEVEWFQNKKKVVNAKSYILDQNEHTSKTVNLSWNQPEVGWFPLKRRAKDMISYKIKGNIYIYNKHNFKYI